jgi:hypothetical protein
MEAVTLQTFHGHGAGKELNKRNFILVPSVFSFLQADSLATQTLKCEPYWFIHLCPTNHFAIHRWNRSDMSQSGLSLGTADIIGIVIGGVLGLTAIVGIIITICAMCARKNNNPQVAAQSQMHYPPNGPYGQPMYGGYYPPPVYQYPQSIPWNQGATPIAQAMPHSSADPRMNPFAKY